MPNMVFSGYWRPYFEGARFVSHGIDLEEEPAGEIAVVSISDSQVTVTKFKYKNKRGENVEYNLTIQRSTGRFSESAVAEGEQVPFTERVGRCIYH